MKNNPFLKKSNERFNLFDEPSKREKVKKDSYNNDSTKKKYDSISHFKSSRPTNKPDTKFIICEHDFPALIKNNNIQIDDSTTNYKDIISSNQIIDNSQHNSIKPGCIEISYINGQIIFKNGPLTPDQIRTNNLKQYEEYLSNDPNYIMNNAINFMKNNWTKYRLDYDSVYGEGAYQEKFIYKNDYEFDNDSDNSSDLDSEYDYEYEFDFIDQNDKDYLV